jgi:hypothetical protein
MIKDTTVLTETFRNRYMSFKNEAQITLHPKPSQISGSRPNRRPSGPIKPVVAFVRKRKSSLLSTVNTRCTSSTVVESLLPNAQRERKVPNDVVPRKIAHGMILLDMTEPAVYDYGKGCSPSFSRSRLTSYKKVVTTADFVVEPFPLACTFSRKVKSDSVPSFVRTSSLTQHPDDESEEVASSSSVSEDIRMGSDCSSAHALSAGELEREV